MRKLVPVLVLLTILGFGQSADADERLTETEWQKQTIISVFGDPSKRQVLIQVDPSFWNKGEAVKWRVNVIFMSVCQAFVNFGRLSTGPIAFIILPSSGGLPIGGGKKSFDECKVFFTGVSA